MTDQKIYADNFRCTFDDPGDFIQFLKERKENSRWMTAPSRNLVFESLEKNTQMGELYLKLYDHDGRAEIIADTMENTSLLLKVNGETYPVRSCAIKSILERARISGHALNKVSKSIFTQILNYCMDVASGDSLIKVADDKVSAVHGGDPKDYAILEILPLVQCVRSILDRDFAGNHFLTANFDHSIVTAIWSLDGQANELMETYRQAVAEKGVTEAMSARPGLRFTTSDVGVSAANLYPILLLGGSNRIIPLGDPLKLDHKNGADLDAFASSMDQLYACFKESIERQQQLLDVEIRYPYTTMLGVLKRIGITKKMSYEVADLFAGQSGVSSGCNAYQLYLAMSDVIFLAQCEGASAYRIAQLEENIARALRINWHEYDRPGDFKW
ncbi:transposase [Intestinimonas butyriciproducens]|uniref:transposase n=1 Tax=Intestinimonas butyriciproducens TaxID=1297617 RepID=UPI001AB02336|nr:transposase [Intestinimonas butyriciproducens]MBO3279182.1 transposase [Intestinimonas butyriciproducens]